MLFKEQIDKRLDIEQQNLHEAVGSFVENVGLYYRLRDKVTTDAHAVREVLSALNVTDNYELDDESPFLTLEEQLKQILSPKGIMYRQVKLKGRWWKTAVGPMLGYDMEGKWVALLPSRTKMAYTYTNKEGRKVEVTDQSMKEDLKTTALCFFPALPMRKINMGDLLNFMVKAFTMNDILRLFLISALIAVLGMFLPYVNKQMFDTVIPNGTKSDIIPVASLLIGATMGGILFNLIRDWMLKRLKELVSIRIEPAVMARTFLLKAKFFMQYSSGELNERIMSVGRLCDLANDMLVSTSITAVFSIVYVFQMKNYAESLMMPGMTIIFGQFVLTIALLWFQRKQDKRMITVSAKLTSLIFDLMNGIQKIKLTGSEKRAFTRWLQTYRESAQLEFNPPLLLKLSGALMVLLNLGGVAFLYFTAAKNQVTPSDYIAFNAAYGMVSGAFMALIGIAPQLSRMEPLLEQAKPIMEAEPEMNEASKQVQFLSGAIEVSHLSFRYSEDTPWILDDVSLKIQPGEYVGVVGRSGCGKSTLMRLMLGFETPDSGAIYYDDYDLSEVDKSSLRQKIGTCLQSGSLFPGDIFSNITITAPWCTHEDAWEAARLAGVAKDIEALPMGMNTLISEGGGGFSGGQKQRLLIARALLNKPSILFFDEATSALDNVSQKMVSDNLDQMGCTRVVIAHRLSTIRHCDRIIVLDKGHIAEEGTYEELKERGGLFTEMIKRQEL